MSADPWSDNVPVPTFGPPMVLHALRDSWADARPHWQDEAAN
jgi:hypothetical protein